ncbi:TIR domain-containing adapter molecule 1-like [Hyla sarda]|uniref:TIR domain-containing adapter molecule 1-like n=1 Tax=Hyla sarda TaxID=327740 RepID=UPI0024C216EF|nr:TIR domain-containing adapter molecule 1-like [Hyla sarda]XP_056427773.1 TIR domain-containing adapter molecule 1-like [Hyla sarda]
MNMMRKTLNSDTESEPHTLRSDLPHGISICKPSHLSSLSLTSNPLQISQSPTKGFLTQEHKSQCKMSSVQGCSMNGNFLNEKLHCGSVPLDKSDISVTYETRSAFNTFAETESSGKEMLVSKGKSDEQTAEKENKRLAPTENSPHPSRNPFAEFSNEPSVDKAFVDRSNSGDTQSNAFSSSQFVSPPTAATIYDNQSSLKFFTFVILHVQEDQDEAMRVCEILHNLDIGQGTTFCEEFETAGKSPLKCLEDAVENSAYIVLLLTNGFLSKWGEFQTNTVLMNSIEDENKSGTIIPFFPKFKMPQGKLPLALKSLTALHEKSHLLKTQVKNTFKRDVIKRQQERWEKDQHLKVSAKCMEDAKGLANFLEKQQHIAMDCKAVYAHLCTQMSSFLSTIPQQIPGQGQVIHINNARNVQIGDQNSMNVQQTTNVPQMGLSGECYQEFGKEF